MHVIEAIEARRSIKRFDPHHRMTRAEQDELLRLARLSPTAFNLQHGRFVVVRDPELRRRLRDASYGQAQVTDASLLVVVCADMGAWRKHAERCWAHVPEPARRGLVEAIERFYVDQPQLQRDEAMRSCSLAAQTLMLAAQGLGYDSCPMDGFRVDDVARLINLPDDHLISMFVALGKALEPAPARGGALPDDVVIIENRFPA
jgi:nitroreductase